MRDLLRSLSTNLHIVVIAMLIVGLGLGMITSSTPGSGKTKRDQSVINLSTTPSVPPKQPPDGSGSSGQPGKSDTQPPPSAPATGPGNGSGGTTAPHAKPSHPSQRPNTAAPSDSDVAAAPAPQESGQLNLPCAMCDDTSECPDSCLTQNQTALPWRRPQPPATICCGGKTVTIAYQPSFVICPTACTDSSSQ